MTASFVASHTGANRSAILVEQFSHDAIVLRRQVDERLLAFDGSSSGSGLCYSYSRDKYAYLTARGEEFIEADPLQQLIEDLRQWGAVTLETTHVSTPSLNIFVGNCERRLLLDKVSARFHYFLCLTSTARKAGTKIALQAPSRRIPRSPISVSRLSSYKVSFNMLLVHSCAFAYSIAGRRWSLDPRDGVVLLDGFMW